MAHKGSQGMFRPVLSPAGYAQRSAQRSGAQRSHARIR